MLIGRKVSSLYYQSCSVLKLWLLCKQRVCLCSVAPRDMESQSSESLLSSIDILEVDLIDFGTTDATYLLHSTDSNCTEQLWQEDDGLTLDCGQVLMNLEGTLNFRCTLCAESAKCEFTSVSSYQAHLKLEHKSTCTVLNVDAQDELFGTISVDPSELHTNETATVAPNHNGKRTPHLTPEKNNNAHINLKSVKNLVKRKRIPGHCDICNRTFNDLYNLRVHMMIHTGEMPYQCEECGKRFRQINKLKIHRITHTNSKPFICDICGKGFRFRNYLSIHRRLHSGEKPYKCKFCDEHFHSLHMRRLHMKVLHSETKTFACPLCPKVLTAQCYLTAHLKRHNNQRDHKCDHCSKCFYNIAQLKDHQLSHTDDKPYECELCQARFQRKSNYKQHVKIHSDIKTYVCHICNKAFAQNAGLYGHMKLHKQSAKG